MNGGGTQDPGSRTLDLLAAYCLLRPLQAYLLVTLSAAAADYPEALHTLRSASKAQSIKVRRVGARPLLADLSMHTTCTSQYQHHSRVL